MQLSYTYQNDNLIDKIENFYEYFFQKQERGKNPENPYLRPTEMFEPLNKL